MDENLKIVWRAPRSENFDLREFALGVLDIAKENLRHDRELISTAFAITMHEIQCYSISFANHDEKPAVYLKLVKAAKESKAIALITCNDAFWSKEAGAEFVEGYYPGKLAAENAKECIMLTVSGPAIETWSVDLPYSRIGDSIEFGVAEEQSGCELGFLNGWASAETTAQ